MLTKPLKLIISILSICLLFFVSKIFAITQVTTSLGINPPPVNIIFTPAYSTGFYTSGNVYAELTGIGIVAPLYMLTENGTYAFNYRRGTGPYTTGAGFSSGNTRIQLSLIDTVSWIDKSLEGGGTGGGGGGGGGGGQATPSVDQCLTRTCNSLYYDALCGPCSTTKTGTTQTGTLSPKVIPLILPPIPTIPPEATKQYSKEILDAYKYAYTLGITTQGNIVQAKLDGPLVRKELAKMVSEYAIKVVGLHPDNSKQCDFPDVADESQEMKYYVRLSCKLGLMGLQADGITVRSTFMANELVNRAQFGTVFSRLIFGLRYDLVGSELSVFNQAMNTLQRTTQKVANFLGIAYTPNIQVDRYTKHLAALEQNNIMQNIDPTMREIRGYVMMMMMRADKNGTIQVHTGSNIAQ